MTESFEETLKRATKSKISKTASKGTGAKLPEEHDYSTRRREIKNKTRKRVVKM